MILDDLKLTLERNKQKNPLYLRNLLKEQLQYYLLNFVYNSPYAERFLFKGGTCLRFCFDLPRLSEDLDFDVYDYGSFNQNQFITDIKTYFNNNLRYTDFEITVSGIHKIMYLKFPILTKIGFPVNPSKPTENLLNIRIDLAVISGAGFKKEISLKSTYDFSFLIRRYSMADLYAGKLAAILTREKFEGKERVPRFKGRDFFDIWWFHEKGIKWNSKYLASLIGTSSREELVSKINTKIQEAAKRKTELRQDLLPFFENPSFVENLVDNLDHLSFA